MQPVQDLTVERCVSRTQYYYTLEDPSLDELARVRAATCRKARKRHQLTDVGSDQQDRGLRVSMTIDRATASRLGITPQLIDDTLYDAFGQRQVSTIFTPAQPIPGRPCVDPEFQKSPPGCKRSISAAQEGQVPLAAIAQTAETTGRS